MISPPITSLITSLITRRQLVVGAPLLVATAPVLARVGIADPILNFLAVGDWGRDGAWHQRDVARQMGIAARQVGSRFTISTGDNFYEDGVASITDRKWQTSFERVYTDPGLQTPWYAVLGNHDYRGCPQAQIDYSANSPRWRMPSRYYKVDGASIGAPHVDLFFIDTSPLVNKYRFNIFSSMAANVRSQNMPAQLAWLDTALARSQAPWKLVIGHHTIFSGSPDHGNTRELVAQVKPILERRGVQAYINGHEHDLQHIRVGAIDYICSGAGSQVRPTGQMDGTRFAMARSGFAVIRVAREVLELEFRDHAGTSIYRAALPARRTIHG